MRILSVLCSLWVLMAPSVSTKAQVASSKDLHKLQVAWQSINTMYVDTVNSSQMAESAIRAMLKNLDPHSSYATAQEVQALNAPLDGGFDGIGIEYGIIHDTLIVTAVLPDGPSDKAGLKMHDKIIAVDDKNICGKTLNPNVVVGLLRGKKGTKVNLLVTRKSEKKELHFSIRRDKIPIYSVEASYMVEGSIGYIKISRFAAQTGDEFLNAIKELHSRGMSALILDLRGNSGGYLNSAIKVADELLTENCEIVNTKGRTSPFHQYNATSKGRFEKGNLVVLIDEGSASASEIVAGAVQDWDRGVIVGRRSFGKGLVQRPLSLPDGSEIRLTTAKYYTPSGRCIQKSYEDGAEEYNKELKHRLDSGELVDGKLEPVDNERYYTKTLGRKVYGGGGIYPDVFVALDTTSRSELFDKIIRTDIMQSYIVTLMEQEKKQLAVHRNIYHFEKTFTVTDPMWLILKRMAAEHNVECTIYELRKEKYLDAWIKANLAKRMFTDGDYYRIMNPHHDIFKKGLEILSQKDAYHNILR